MYVVRYGKGTYSGALLGSWAGERESWQVGYWAPDGSWISDSAFESEEDAAAQASYMNGGAHPTVARQQREAAAETERKRRAEESEAERQRQEAERQRREAEQQARREESERKRREREQWERENPELAAAEKLTAARKSKATKGMWGWGIASVMAFLFASDDGALPPVNYLLYAVAVVGALGVIGNFLNYGEPQAQPVPEQPQAQPVPEQPAVESTPPPSFPFRCDSCKSTGRVEASVVVAYSNRIKCFNCQTVLVFCPCPRCGGDTNYTVTPQGLTLRLGKFDCYKCKRPYVIA